MRSVNGLVLLGCAALCSLVAFVPIANAGGTRVYPGSACTASNSSQLTYSSGQLQNASSATVNLYCPVLQGTDFPASSNNAVFVSGYAHFVPNSFFGDVLLSACRTYSGGGGGACGAVTYGSSNGNQAQVFQQRRIADTSKWPTSGTTDFLYVNVSLGPVANGSDDDLFGYQVND